MLAVTPYVAILFRAVADLPRLTIYHFVLFIIFLIDDADSNVSKITGKSISDRKITKRTSKLFLVLRLAASKQPALSLLAYHYSGRLLPDVIILSLGIMLALG